MKQENKALDDLLFEKTPKEEDEKVTQNDD
jgi:hypothetical protein